MQSIEDRIALLAAHWRVIKPQGAGPFPVAVQLHGCGGPKAFQETWAEVARSAGAAAIVVDSYAPRRISALAAYATVCTGARLPGRERAGDLFAALAWARRQAWAAPDKLVAAGWSHGGWTVSDALSFKDGAEMRRATGLRDLSSTPLAGLAGVFLVYPWLGWGVLRGRRWRPMTRTIAIIGGKDNLAGGRAPYRFLDQQKALGAPIEIVAFANATHAFDEPGSRDPRARYDAQAVDRAHEIYADLLRSL